MTCAECGRRIYLDERTATMPVPVYRHYTSDSEFCYPQLSSVEAFGFVAHPESPVDVNGGHS
jgi:hypothetical protein